tara:strand:+ start:2246 stop:2407 length:162 start_codon:yes stop_codon:yes gene_type:complete
MAKTKIDWEYLQSLNSLNRKYEMKRIADKIKKEKEEEEKMKLKKTTVWREPDV